MTSSKRVKTVFEKHAIHHELDRLVESVLDINNVGIYLFEKLAAEISDPTEAYERLKTLQFSLSLR